MSLIVFCLQRIVLLHITSLLLFVSRATFRVLLNMLLVLFDLLLVHLHQCAEGHLNVCDQGVEL